RDIYTLIMLFEALRLGNDISLRPEATASACRAYIEHNMQQLPQPVKLYYTVIPAGSLVMGSPGKVKRMLTGIDQASIDAYAQRYVEYKNIYREEPAE